MRRAILLLFACLAFTTVVSAQFGRVGDVFKRGKDTADAMKPITTEQEVAMGKEVASKMIAYMGVFDNPKAVEYVRKVGAVVAAQAERKDVKYYFEILDADDVNAFATPGGYIFVTVGLLEKVKSEAELAAVLGHEVGHVAGKHIVNQMQSGKALQAGLKEASNFTPGSQYLKEIASQILMQLVDRGLDHKYEYDADERGVNYAYAAGYRPDGALSFFSTLQPLVAQSEASTAWMNRTHPKVEDRIERVKRLIADKKMETEGRPDNFERYQRTMKAAAGQ